MNTPLRPPLATRRCKTDGCEAVPAGQNQYCETCRKERVRESKRKYQARGGVDPLRYIYPRMERIERSLMQIELDLRRLLGRAGKAEVNGRAA